MRYLSRLAVWLGGKYAGQETDISLILQWLYEAGNEYLAQQICRLHDIVQRKRILYGLPQLSWKGARKWNSM